MLHLRLSHYARPELTFDLCIQVREMCGALVCLNNGWRRKDTLAALAEDMSRVHPATELSEKLLGNNH
jgi:hypothetical protein